VGINRLKSNLTDGAVILRQQLWSKRFYQKRGALPSFLWPDFYLQVQADCVVCQELNFNFRITLPFSEGFNSKSWSSLKSAKALWFSIYVNPIGGTERIIRVGLVELYSTVIYEYFRFHRICFRFHLALIQLCCSLAAYFRFAWMINRHQKQFETHLHPYSQYC
jgi:hypothetical protein